MRKLLIILVSSLLWAGCASLDGVNLTGIDDSSLTKKEGRVLVSVVEMKETNKQGMFKIDDKRVEPAGRYFLIPGRHRVTVRFRKAPSARWRYGTTTLNLNGGSTYAFSAFSSGYGMMTMLMEKSWYIKGRIDKVKYGMTKGRVKKIMKVKPSLTMTIGRKNSPNRRETWSYSNKKEYGSVTFNNKGRVAKTYWGWKKNKKK